MTDWIQRTIIFFFKNFDVTFSLLPHTSAQTFDRFLIRAVPRRVVSTYLSFWRLITASRRRKRMHTNAHIEGIFDKPNQQEEEDDHWIRTTRRQSAVWVRANYCARVRQISQTNQHAHSSAVSGHQSNYFYERFKNPESGCRKKILDKNTGDGFGAYFQVKYGKLRVDSKFIFAFNWESSPAFM